MRTLNRQQYFDALQSTPTSSKSEDFVVSTMCHSIWGPSVFDKVMASYTGNPIIAPRLLSRAQVANSTGKSVKAPNAYEPNIDTQSVFCYLAPRTRQPNRNGTDPQTQGLYILVFATRDARVAASRARPFDSGGLVRSRGGLNDSELLGLLNEMTLDAPWSDQFQLYGSRLFDGLHAYLRGEPPKSADPLNLLPNDPLNFTWELLFDDELSFDRRLVALLDVRFEDSESLLPSNGSLSSVSGLDGFRARYAADRIELREHIFDIAEPNRLNELQRVLHEVCETAQDKSGW